ncbi:MAG: Gfo/Idh/MocA family oxidoreductase [Nitrospiraceae bacterium]|nr:Gfo/Idh/MocA family oxidoreductase [Nitrospiraceae bacterium]
MRTTKIGVGVVGTGFIGPVHIDALRRLGHVEIVALGEANQELARAKADALGIPKAYGDFNDLINDADVEVVHNCTPNNMHLEINSAIVQAGKHVFSEKPLAMDSNESAQLLQLAQEHGVVHGVNFNYRLYPLAQEMRHRIARGDIGDVRLIHGSYLQDWLLYPTDYNWRIEPEISGATRAVGDIGSHWCDLAQCVTGLRIAEVCADFATVISVRKKARNVETFAKASEATEWDEKPVRTEDWAGVLVRFENGARGVFSVSEVSAGRKCRLDIEINGSEKTFYWNQEQGDRLWVGTRNEGNQEIIRDPNWVAEAVRPHTFAPAGHPEGWLDNNAANIRAFYEFIREGKDSNRDPAAFATFRDGHDIMLILRAITESAATGRWVKVQRAEY